MPKQILLRGSVPEAVGLDEKVGGGEVEATTFAEVAEVYIVARRSCPSAEIYDLHENFCCSKFGGKKCCRAVWTVPEAADSNKEAAGLLPGDDDQQQVGRGLLGVACGWFPVVGSGSVI